MNRHKYEPESVGVRIVKSNSPFDTTTSKVPDKDIQVDSKMHRMQNQHLKAGTYIVADNYATSRYFYTSFNRRGKDLTNIHIRHTSGVKSHSFRQDHDYFLDVPTSRKVSGWTLKGTAAEFKPKPKKLDPTSVRLTEMPLHRRGKKELPVMLKGKSKPALEHIESLKLSDKKPENAPEPQKNPLPFAALNFITVAVRLRKIKSLPFLTASKLQEPKLNASAAQLSAFAANDNKRNKQ